MDVRKVGSIIGASGLAALAVAMLVDRAQHASDPLLAAHEHLLTLTTGGHLVGFLGVAAMLVGATVVAFGPRLYQPVGANEVGRRFAQLAAPAVAFALIVGGGIGANAASSVRTPGRALTAAAADGHDHTEGSVGHDHGDGADHGAAHDPGATGDHAHAGSSDADHVSTDGDHAHGADDSAGAGSGVDHPGHTVTGAGTDHSQMVAGSSDHGHATGAGTDSSHGTGGHDHATSGADPSGSSSAAHDNHSSAATDHDHTTMTTGSGSTSHDHDHTTVSSPGPTTPGGATPPHDHDHTTPSTIPGTPDTTAPAFSACGNGSAHGHGAEPVALSAEMQAQQDQQLAQAKAFALNYPTAADAVNAGYVQVTHYLCGIGAHYLNISFLDAKFEAGKPEMLLYDNDGPDAKLVGISYYVSSHNEFDITGRQVGPAGFVGPNDGWHQHIGLCLNVFFVIGPESWTDEQCRAAGGVKQSGSALYWLLHAWVVPGYEMPGNVFSPVNPALKPGPWDFSGVVL